MFTLILIVGGIAYVNSILNEKPQVSVKSSKIISEQKSTMDDHMRKIDILENMHEKNIGRKVENVYLFCFDLKDVNGLDSDSIGKLIVRMFELCIRQNNTNKIFVFLDCVQDFPIFEHTKKC